MDMNDYTFSYQLYSYYTNLRVIGDKFVITNEKNKFCNFYDTG